MNLEEIKRKKMQELENQAQSQLQNQLKEQLALQQQVEQLEIIVKQYLTKEAIARYGNLRAAHPEKAIQVLTVIGQALQTGQITGKIDDNMLKQLLQQMQKPKKEFKMMRK